jgi:transcriptional regulator with XRE-family HTH domain
VLKSKGEIVKDVTSQIGSRIRELRKKKGLSQEELGGRAKLHYTYIGAVERGEKNVSVVTLNKIARALGISLNEIFIFPKEIKDPVRLKELLINEIDKSNPEIVRLVFNLARELNRLKYQVSLDKGRERK